MSADALLLAALQAAPRRYRMPALPGSVHAARTCGPETALAFAIESARLAKEQAAPAPAAVQALFTWALAGLVREALAVDGGDAAFQALVLRAQDAQVEEHVRLAATQAADRRAVRTATDTVAHPGKLRSHAPGAVREALSHLHQLAAAEAWSPLRGAVDALLGQQQEVDPSLRAGLMAIVASPALQRLERGAALRDLTGVQQYQALCGQRGPQAGSSAASAQGRASARLGQQAEQATVQAFREIAGWLGQHAGEAARHRVLRGLRTPRGFPGPAEKAKDEWDAAIVRTSPAGSALEVVLLAEVKAAPAAATPDFARLLRGLQRLGRASADADYVFASGDGEVQLSGLSLRRLQPHGQDLPPHVIYCCSAPAETQPQMLSAASKAVLLAEPASLAFAQHLLRGAPPPDRSLSPVWRALTTEPRLRAALHQYDTARAARAAMLHPDDLLASIT